jgi:DNA processing protein
VAAPHRQHPPPRRRHRAQDRQAQRPRRIAALPALTDSERLDWLRLIRSENVGPVVFRQLLRRYGTAEAALRALPDLARQGGRMRPIRLCPKGQAEREIEALGKRGGRLVGLDEPAYPAALAAIEDAPPLVSVLGEAALLGRPCVGIVGARNASANGRRLAERLALGLAEAGFTVVSGMARGIDSAAHRAALERGTAAVVAGGIDVVYPSENTALYQSIVETGAVVSEQPLGTEPQARHFPRRNRLISGLSAGIVVVEAALRSGSLITARCAADQGREVFAVPGSPLDPRARGANNLLRQGAVLTESVDDILDALQGSLGALPVAGPAPSAPSPAEGPVWGAAIAPAADDSELAAARRTIETHLSAAPVTVDELVRRCQLSAPVVSMALLELELAGRIERQPGGRIALAYE